MARTVDVKVGPFEKQGVEAPDQWSDTAVGIAARMYMTADETSVYQLVERVAGSITAHGILLGYFEGAAADIYRQKLEAALLAQQFAFNTPVWMNIGVPDRSQQAWACLILDVDDSMESIEAGWGVESATFRGGSGSGVNISKIRAAGEPLSDGNGVGSGPISLWMRPTDAIAGVVRSGGRTRRAAKMVVMNIDHPEIIEFIRCKADAEKMARDLQRLGYDISMTGADSANIPFQQANNSVRVTDEFMTAVKMGHGWQTVYRRSGETAGIYEANELWRAISQAAWECGDPGIQFHDTTNRWHTCPNDGEIVASNPCSEYLWLNNTVCNLASVNLMAFETDAGFDIRGFLATVDLAVTAMDILVDLTSYPTQTIAETSRLYRTLGLGFTNLGALIMSRGLPYDSDQGRSLAASIMALLQARAVKASATLAKTMGAYPAFQRNRRPHLRVLKEHSKQAVGFTGPIWDAAKAEWTAALAAAEDSGQRNAQLSVIAPTGTISLMMDCETTGIEPVLAIDATKHLVGGGTLDVGVQKCVAKGREKAGADPKVFQTALGDNPVSPEGHVRMMAAVQPFVSGGISKTVNLPSTATAEDIASVYELAWKSGLKAIAVFRDGCKAYQPVTSKGNTPDTDADAVLSDSAGSRGRSLRRRPSGTRAGVTHKFNIAGVEYYVTVNEYPDGTPCELFITCNKHGSAIAGWVAAFSIATSLGLQYGVPIEKYIEHFQRMNFMPQGLVVADSDIKMADSPADYIFRWIDQRWVPVSSEQPITEADTATVLPFVIDAPCGICGSSRWLPTGTCKTCADCGQVSGGCA